ncbi:unnamed protein product [Linum trigynum]|uniref:Uncharacterized protein n=1 Tax=Linum trigynum TaxID=586398 RepID=A0AAV2CUQ9_9ROSI
MVGWRRSGEGGGTQGSRRRRAGRYGSVEVAERRGGESSPLLRRRLGDVWRRLGDGLADVFVREERRPSY